MDLKGRHFLKLLDYTPEEIQYLLDLAAALKEKKKIDIQNSREKTNRKVGGQEGHKKSQASSAWDFLRRKLIRYFFLSPLI